MFIELHEETGVAIVELEGRLNARAAGALRQRLKNLIEGGRSWIVADLRRVEFIDSVGLASLVSGLKMARTNSGDLRLAGLQGPVRMVFEITRLYRTFDIHENTPDAVEAFLQEARSATTGSEMRPMIEA